MRPTVTHVGAIASADALIIRSDIVDEDVIEATSKLRLSYVQVQGTTVLTSKLVKRKTWSNEHVVAELRFCMILTSARRTKTIRVGLSSYVAAWHLTVSVRMHASAQYSRKFPDMTTCAYDLLVPSEPTLTAGATSIAAVPELFCTSVYLFIVR